MAFETYSYTANDGDEKPIRLTAAYATAGSFSLASGLSDRDFVKVSKSAREFGMRPRGVRVRRRGDDGIQYRFVPMATEAAYNSAIAAGSVTIGSTAWTVVTPVPEDV